MSGAWKKLLADDQIPTVFRAFVNAVEKSFQTNAMIVTPRSRAEEVRRVEMCGDIFEKLRAGAGWSLQRIADELPRILRCELDGEPWSVDSRSAWSPEGG